MERQVLTVVEVAQVLGLSRNATYEAIRRGDIPSIRVGRRVVIPIVSLKKMLDVSASEAEA